MSVVVTFFINDESPRPQTLLKTESTTKIVINQDHKYQNSYIKERLWKATVLQKACTLRACYEICS